MRAKLKNKLATGRITKRGSNCSDVIDIYSVKIDNSGTFHKGV